MLRGLRNALVSLPLVAVALSSFACTSKPAFDCTSNTACINDNGAQGMCESTGFCSFPDTACTGSQRRYAAGASSALASNCVAPLTTAQACISAISVGIDFVCALKTDGTVWCWGANDSGQLGDGTQVDRATPKAVLGITDVTTLASAEEHVCVLKKDNTVWCWGVDDSKQLGQCDPPDLSTTPVEVQSFTMDAQGNPQCQAGTPFKASLLTSGGEHNCAIGLDGNLYCWGENQTGSQGGQSGQDPLKFDDVPGPLVISGGFDGPVDVRAGDEYTCALKDEHSVWCWGANDLDELGNGGGPLSFTAVNVQGFSDASQLVIDDETGCALTHDGSLWCWGNGSTGIFPGTSLANQASPVRVTTATNVFSGSTGELLCLTQSDNQLQCWGANDKGQTGTGSAVNPIVSPTPIALTSVKTASIGQDNVCALTQDGELFCWGDSSRSQLGPGYSTTVPQTTPARVQFPCP